MFLKHPGRSALFDFYQAKMLENAKKYIDFFYFYHYFLWTIFLKRKRFTFQFVMKLKVLWPGRTRNREIRSLEEHYLNKINQLGKCQLIQVKEAKGINEKFASRIKEIEALELEKRLKDDYIICLFDRGKEMSSLEFARFLEKTASSSGRFITFIVGGFLGLDERLLKRADFLLSLSRMTFSHELSRAVLLEQIYRSLTIIKGRHYAK